MTTSMLTRMAVNLGVFVILSRWLGPKDFGLVATIYAYAGIASLLTDFGLAWRTLRDIAANPAKGGNILLESICIKAALTLLAVAFGGLAIALLPLSTDAKLASCLLGAGVLIGSIADLSLVAYRATQKFGGETWIVIWTSIFYGAVVIVIVLLHGGVLAVSAGYIFSRCIYLLIAVRSSRSLFPHVAFDRLRLGGLFENVRTSVPWAIDGGLSYIAGQVHVLIVPHVLGLAAAGVYQSGARFVLAAITLVTILTNIHVSRLSAKRRSDEFVRAEILVVAEFLGVGFLFAAFFLFCGPLLTKILLGEQYLSVNMLWPGFAAFILARYAASAFGVSLLALAKIKVRILGQIVAILFTATSCYIVLPRLGLVSGPWIMTFGSLITLAFYALARMTYRPQRELITDNSAA